MQTFLPIPDFRASARVLDRARLGKQRVEVLQMLNALDLNRPKQRWATHPATLMWQGHPVALAIYGLTCCEVWRERGYRDTCFDKILKTLHSGWFEGSSLALPPWFGDDAFHKSHRSNLVRKKPEHYRRFFPRTRDDLPYVWPPSPLAARIMDLAGRDLMRYDGE